VEGLINVYCPTYLSKIVIKLSFFGLLPGLALFFIVSSAKLHDSTSPEQIFLMFTYIAANFLLFSVNDLLLFYLIIEFQGLSAYVLAAAFKNNTLSVEAGIKYFVLGSIASGFILFGIVLVYGFSGTLLINSLYLLLYNNHDAEIVLVGFIFIVAGLFFKLCLFPFHSWVPDVYSGSPFIVTALFAVVPKIPLVYILLYFITNIFYHLDLNLDFNFYVIGCYLLYFPFL